MIKMQKGQYEKMSSILDQVRESFYRAHEEFNFNKIGEENKIHDTTWVLVMLSFRLDCLCESVLSCEEYYASAIIYRSIIEHSLKHKYIFMSTDINDENVAREYVSSDHIMSEILKKHHKWKKYQKSNWPIPIESTGKLKELKRSSDKISDKFRFDNVSGSILANFPEDEYRYMLRGFSLQYSTLSSYVHAGPTAVLDLKEKPKKNIDRNCMVLALIAYRDTIVFLSEYQSEHQIQLKTLAKEIDGKVEEALNLCHTKMHGE